MSGGRIVQFDYGEDRFDGTWMLRASMPPLDAALDERPGTTIDEIRALAASRLARTKASQFLSAYKSAPRIPIDFVELLRQARAASTTTDRNSYASRATRFETFMCSLQPLAQLTEAMIRCTIHEELLLDIDETWFEWLLQEIEIQLARGRVHPGEAVGVLAAQSIAEQVYPPPLFYTSP